MPRRRSRVAPVLRDREAGRSGASAPSETPKADSSREEVVGDAHLVAIGVGTKGQQRRVLRLPAESPDAPRPGGDVDDHIAARPLTPSRLRSSGILQRQQRVVGNGLDQPGAEQRNGRPPRDDVDVVGNHPAGSRASASRTCGSACRPPRSGRVMRRRRRGSRRAPRESRRRRRWPGRCGRRRSSCR